MKLEDIKSENDIKEILIENITQIAKDPSKKNIKSYEKVRNYIEQNHKFDLEIYNIMFKALAN